MSGLTKAAGQWQLLKWGIALFFIVIVLMIAFGKFLRGDGDEHK